MSKPYLVTALCAAVLLPASPLQSQPQQQLAPQPASGALTYLDQGWDASLRETFYFTPQGSRLMPYAWFLAIEQANSQALFVDPPYLSRLGLIYADPTPSLRNPDGLPIGFTKETAAPPEKIKEWVGMTCAACHTSNITAGGKVVRIDGGPATADFTLFLRALTGAVRATIFEPGKEPFKGDKYKRFAERVLGTHASQVAKDRLDARVCDFCGHFRGLL